MKRFTQAAIALAIAFPVVGFAGTSVVGGCAVGSHLSDSTLWYKWQENSPLCQGGTFPTEDSLTKKPYAFGDKVCNNGTLYMCNAPGGVSPQPPAPPKPSPTSKSFQSPAPITFTQGSIIPITVTIVETGYAPLDKQCDQLSAVPKDGFSISFNNPPPTPDSSQLCTYTAKVSSAGTADVGDHYSLHIKDGGLASTTLNISVKSAQPTSKTISGGKVTVPQNKSVWAYITESGYVEGAQCDNLTANNIPDNILVATPTAKKSADSQGVCSYTAEVTANAQAQVSTSAVTINDTTAKVSGTVQVSVTKQQPSSSVKQAIDYTYTDSSGGVVSPTSVNYQNLIIQDETDKSQHGRVASDGTAMISAADKYTLSGTVSGTVKGQPATFTLQNPSVSHTYAKSQPWKLSLKEGGAPGPGPIPGPNRTTGGVVTAYLMLNSKTQLDHYKKDITSIVKPNFNRLIISFVDPRTTYQKNSDTLANTGLLGFNVGDTAPGDSPALDFQELKSVIKVSKEKGIETFISVGGWNFSCDPTQSQQPCGPTNEHYSTFADPSDSGDYKADYYDNIVSLANDLGVQGIDVDYEEFWYADKYKETWKFQKTGPTGILSTFLPKLEGIEKGTTREQIIKANSEYTPAMGQTPYNMPQSVNKLGTATGSGSAYIMPRSIDKLDNILKKLMNNSSATKLKFAAAVPAAGGRPITGLVYGDNGPAKADPIPPINDPDGTVDDDSGKPYDVDNAGGVWWGGNLKGIIYSLYAKDRAVVNRLDSIGVMTYDLAGDAPFAGAQTDLASQVDEYMNDFTNWLKAPTSTDGKILIDKDNGSAWYLPAKFHMDALLQFGLEVNKPGSGDLDLTKESLNDITTTEKKKPNVKGDIVWWLYSPENQSISNAPSVQDALRASCNAFLSDKRQTYDCDAQFPSPSSATVSKTG